MLLYNRHKAHNLKKFDLLQGEPAGHHPIGCGVRLLRRGVGGEGAQANSGPAKSLSMRIFQCLVAVSPGKVVAVAGFDKMEIPGGL